MTECNNLRESPSDVRLSKEAIWRSTHCALYCNALQTALSIILIAYWSTKKAISCSTHCTLCHIALEIAYCPMPIAYIILHIAHWSTKKAIWNCANCTLYYIAICTLHVDRPKRQYGAVQIATTRPSLALTSLLFFELIKDYLLTAKRARGLLLLNCNLKHHKLGWPGHLNSKYCRKAISWHPSRAIGGASSSFFQWQLAGQYDGLVSGLFFFLPTIFMGRMICFTARKY